MATLVCGNSGNVVVEKAAVVRASCRGVRRTGSNLRPGPQWDRQPKPDSFTVSGFALLDSGERVILRDERGYSGKSSSSIIWSHETVETITRNVLTALLPDDDDTDDEHSWEFAELARDRGFVVAADDCGRSLTRSCSPSVCSATLHQHVIVDGRCVNCPEQSIR